MEQISSSIKEKTETSAETPLKKTYSCSFCSRGFLNAQALGGHMNIHRKDRAKLVMQSLDDESSLDDVPKKNDPVRGDDGHHIHQHAESGRQEKASSPERPCVTVSREDGPMEQSKLSVASSLLTNREEKQGGSPDMLLEEKKIDELNHGRSFPLELDLELRLGVRP